MYYSICNVILSLLATLKLRNSSEVPLLLTPLAYDCLQMTYIVSYKSSAWTYKKHVTWSLSTVGWHHRLHGSVFTELLLRNGLHNPIVPPLLCADNIENTASSTVVCWTVFTELLPGNTLMKSTTIFFSKIPYFWLYSQKIHRCRHWLSFPFILWSH
jgi:hypothetical protein